MTKKQSDSPTDPSNENKDASERRADDDEQVDPAAHSGTLETSDPDNTQDADDVSAAVQEGLVAPGTSHEPGPGEQIVTVDGQPHTVPVESVDAVVEQAHKDRGDSNIQEAVEKSRDDHEDDSDEDREDS